MCTLFHLIYVFGYGLLRIYVCHIDTSGQRKSNAFGKLGSKIYELYIGYGNKKHIKQNLIIFSEPNLDI